MSEPAIVPPPGYVMRRPRTEDLAPAAALIAAAEAFDTGLGDTTADLLLEEWEGPGFELSEDAWLVFAEATDRAEGSDPVGYASIEGRDQERQLGSGVIVHPEHRGRGIGWYLTDLVAARAAERAAMAPPGDPVVLLTNLPARDRAGHRLLEERGFTPARYFWHMEATLTDDLPSPPSVPGVSLRGFVLGQDDRAVHRAIQESFAEHWGFVTREFDEWAAHRLHEHTFDPDWWWVAEEGDEVVAALCGSVVDGVAWVGMLGVRSPWRKRGIGEALLRRSFLEFRRRGLGTVRLGVDAANETGATALYERVGMHVIRQFDVYEQRLR